jgi:hypothetical protein
VPTPSTKAWSVALGGARLSYLLMVKGIIYVSPKVRKLSLASD